GGRRQLGLRQRQLLQRRRLGLQLVQGTDLGQVHSQLDHFLHVLQGNFAAVAGLELHRLQKLVPLGLRRLQFEGRKGRGRGGGRRRRGGRGRRRAGIGRPHRRRLGRRRHHRRPSGRRRSGGGLRPPVFSG